MTEKQLRSMLSGKNMLERDRLISRLLEKRHCNAIQYAAGYCIGVEGQPWTVKGTKFSRAGYKAGREDKQQEK